MGAVSHLLKILNGPHTGAQSGFGEGDVLSIGSSPEDDIILSDPHILPGHCRISLSSGECSVTPVEGDVLVSGRPISTSEAVTSDRVITIGSTSLVVGPREGSWPSVTIPDVRRVGKFPGAVPSPGSEGTVKERSPAAKVIRIVLPTLLGVALILLAGSYFSANQVKTPRHPEYPGAAQKKIEEHTDLLAGEALDSLQKMITGEMPEVTVIRNNSSPHGELVVLAPDEEKTLRARRITAQDSRRALFVQVINMEELERVLAQLIQAKAPTLWVVVARNGNLVWNGYLRSEEGFPAIRDQVRQDIQFLGKDEVNIVFGEPLAKKIEAEIMQRGIGPGIMVKAGEKGLVLSGGVPPGKSDLWKRTIASIIERHPGVMIENRVDSAMEGQQLEKILGSPVAGITFGKSTWIELSNGVRLFPGSNLPNGITLLSISTTEIRFQTPSGLLMIPVSAIDSRQPAR